jgi:hypothetical protein
MRHLPQADKFIVGQSEASQHSQLLQGVQAGLVRRFRLASLPQASPHHCRSVVKHEQQSAIHHIHQLSIALIIICPFLSYNK